MNFKNNPEMVATNSEVQRTNNEEEVPASQDNLTGKWQAFFRKDVLGGGEVPVRPLTSEDINKILGVIILENDKREEKIKGILGLNKRKSDYEIMDDAEIAKKTTDNTAQGTDGLVEFFIALNNSIKSKDRLNEKTAEIFVIDEDRAQHLFNLDKPNLKNRKLDKSLTGENLTNKGIQYCFAVLPEKGAEFMSILTQAGHRVDDFGRGFQAEIGGIRLAFLYPEKFRQKDDKTEEKEDTSSDEE